MSSILKALEKAEESNSTKRLGGDSDLIRSRRSRPTWVMPTAVLCGAAVATLITFAAMGGFSRRAPAPAPQLTAKTGPVVVAPLNPVVETTAVPSAPVVPEGAAVVPDPNALPAKVTEAVPLPGLKAALPLGLKTARPAAILKVVPTVGLKATPHPKLPVAAAIVTKRAAAPAALAPVAPVEKAPVAAAVPARPELKVSGIAWQNNGESSFAVVNGRAVLQGSTVDGFKVLEIRQDMVRFSGSNGNIDVPLGEEK